MKNFFRNNTSFSLCGLNCALCPMHIGNYCPGCGGGEGNQSCKMAKCSIQHERLEYCFKCPEFPCKNYEGIDTYDSFITHQNRHKDLIKAKSLGIAGYQKELDKKATILNTLLGNYNDGRKKTLFCISVNLLELDDVEKVMTELFKQTQSCMTLKEKASLAAKLFHSKADEKNIVLKLRKK